MDNSTLLFTLMQTARRELGVREQGSNWGPKVQDYLASVGIHQPAAWCAALVWWVIQKTAAELQRPELLAIFRGIKPRDFAYVPNILTWARKMGIVHNSPRPGDFFLSMRPNGQPRHVGFVDLLRGGRFLTVEGNSNSTGSPEGTRVCANFRNPTGPYLFVRWLDLLADVAAPPAARRTLYLSDKKLWDMPLQEGVCMCPVRPWLNALGFQDSHIGWEDGDVTVDGRPIEADVLLRDDGAYAPIRQLASDAGLEVQKVDAEGVWIGRPQ